MNTKNLARAILFLLSIGLYGVSHASISYSYDTTQLEATLTCSVPSSHRCEWFIPNRAPQTATQVVHTFPSTGTYTVKLNVLEGVILKKKYDIYVTVTNDAYCNSDCYASGSSINCRLKGSATGYTFDNIRAGTTSGLTSNITKRVFSCNTENVYSGIFPGLCSYDCEQNGSGIYCDKKNSNGSIVASNIYMGVASYITTEMNHEAIVSCNNSVPAEPNTSGMCYLSCYSSGSSVLCDKKNFNGSVVQSGFQVATTSAILPSALSNQIVACN